MIDRYIDDLESLLHLPRRQRSRVLREVRDHLDDAVASLALHSEESGPGVQKRALDAFGRAEDLASQLNALSATRSMRRSPMAVFVAGVCLVAGLLVAVATQPVATSPRPARPVAQVVFFVALLGFQVALVAGARAGSLVLSLWRIRTARVADRQLVHRCAVICAVGLLVASTGWAVVTWSAMRAQREADVPTLDAGIALMLAAAVVAIIVLGRARVNPFDEAAEADEPASGLLSLGERIIDCVRQHPASACAAVAIVSGLGAMSHAETTVVAAVPWGAVQAAAVVVGFIVLAPRLDIRDPTRS